MRVNTCHSLTPSTNADSRSALGTAVKKLRISSVQIGMPIAVWVMIIGHSVSSMCMRSNSLNSGMRMICGGKNMPEMTTRKTQLAAAEGQLGEDPAGEQAECDGGSGRRRGDQQSVEEVGVDRGVGQDLDEIAEIEGRRDRPQVAERDSRASS